MAAITMERKRLTNHERDMRTLNLAFYGGMVMGALWLAIAVLLILILTGTHIVLAQSVDDVLVPPTPEEARDIQTWMPQQCCWSNRCCRKVTPASLHPLSRDQYRVVVTGQIVPRTGWSRDGNTWRCTCDQNEEGRWVVHLKANTRCIFPVPQGY